MQVIATRWASTLKSSKLKIVMCANDGYLAQSDSLGSDRASGANGTDEDIPMTNFSCRIANRARGEDVSIIQMLLEYADRVPGLRESLGDNFARGHKEASGGIVRSSDFEKLWVVMRDSKPDDEEGMFEH